jgi:hypothetical protein
MFQTSNIATTSASSNLFSNSPQHLPNVFSTPITTIPPTTSSSTATHHAANHQNCDDLDCFFCEQIATHIEHKRSATNTDLDSPTRKRSRFY